MAASLNASTPSVRPRATLALKGHLTTLSRAMLLCAAIAGPAFGQCTCQPPPDNASRNANGKPSGWRQNSTVNVYLDTTQYDANQRAAIKGGFTNWNNTGNNANVTYNFVEQSGPPASPSGYYVVVRKQNPSDATLDGQTNWNYTAPQGSTTNYTDNATMSLKTTITDLGMLTELVAHEVGHLVFLGDCPSCPACTSVMAIPLVAGQSNTGPTSCDNQKSNQTSGYLPPPPPPPSCELSPDCPNPDYDTCTCSCVLGPSYADTFSASCSPSPIILAVGPSSDYQLVGAGQGVSFDLNSDGVSERLGWTRANDLVGFLALDRNHNGIIDDGRELFGNFTPVAGNQIARSGFEALAYLDSDAAGGNGDGWIDAQDAVWPDLRLWIDLNHDGFSQPGELFPLSAFKITRISTQPSLENRRDRFGNVFRLRGEFIIDGHPRWGYDVFFGWR